ncbi:MAG: gas vesicle protein K [Myxococcota bacterium]|nr:gas vesicle protein K [Myxococcota bacterium]
MSDTSHPAAASFPLGPPPSGRPAAAKSPRLNLDPEKVQRDFARLVLVIVELVRRLLEKQALRRIEGGSLSTEQVERLGTTLMRLDAEVKDLQAHFGIRDLDLDLGPLGRVLGRPTGPRTCCDGG